MDPLASPRDPGETPSLPAPKRGPGGHVSVLRPGRGKSGCAKTPGAAIVPRVSARASRGVDAESTFGILGKELGMEFLFAAEGVGFFSQLVDAFKQNPTFMVLNMCTLAVVLTIVVERCGSQRPASRSQLSFRPAGQTTTTG